MNIEQQIHNLIGKKLEVTIKTANKQKSIDKVKITVQEIKNTGKELLIIGTQKIKKEEVKRTLTLDSIIEYREVTR